MITHIVLALNWENTCPTIYVCIRRYSTIRKHVAGPRIDLKFCCCIALVIISAAVWSTIDDGIAIDFNVISVTVSFTFEVTCEG